MAENIGDLIAKDSIIRSLIRRSMNGDTITELVQQYLDKVKAQGKDYADKLVNARNEENASDIAYYYKRCVEWLNKRYALECVLAGKFASAYQHLLTSEKCAKEAFEILENTTDNLLADLLNQ